MGATPMVTTSRMEWVRAVNRTSTLTLSERAIVHAMCERADSDSLEFFQTIDELAEWTGASNRTVSRAIDSAIKKGWIVRKKRGNGGRATRYELAFGAIRKPAEEGETLQTIVSPVADAVCHQWHVQGDTSVTRSDPEVTLEVTPRDSVENFDPARDSVKRERSTATTDDDTITAPHRPSQSMPEKKTAGTAERITASWHTNGVHVSACKLHGMDAQALAADFKRWARGEGVRRSDWNSTFGELIRLLGDEQCPDDNGYIGWDSYGYTDRSDYEHNAPRRCPECGEPVEAGQVRHPACLRRAS